MPTIRSARYDYPYEGRFGYLLLIVVLSTLMVTGCAPIDEGVGSTQDATGVDSATSGAPADTLTEDELAEWGMSVPDKQTLFEPGFPWQAPVIDGTIAIAEVDARDTHFYRIEVGRSAEHVTEWYRRSYPNANWLIHDTRVTSENGFMTTVLEVTKGQGAWSRILVEGDDTSAVVEASIGVGSPPEGVF